MKTTDSEETLYDNKVSTNNKPRIIKAALAGTALGLGAGVATAAGVHSVQTDGIQGETANEDSNPATKPVDQTNASTNESPTVPIAENHDELSFTDAFNTAREEVGAGGIFKWHGRYYGTYNSDEWNNMSDADKQTYISKMPEQIHEADNSWEHGYAAAQANHESNTENIIQAQVTNNTDDLSTTPVNATHIEPTTSVPEVEVLNVGVVSDNNGNQQIVAQMRIDGHDALMVDVNMDGRMDGVLIDANDNGQLDPGEAVELHNDIRVDDLIAAQGDVSNTDTQLASNDQLPDYTNDADISTLV